MHPSTLPALGEHLNGERMLQIRFMIGLRDANGLLLTRAEVRGAWDYFREQYHCCSKYEGEGSWFGGEEPCMVLEVVADGTGHARSNARIVAGELACRLGQESVGLGFTPTDLELIGPKVGAND